MGCHGCRFVEEGCRVNPDAFVGGSIVSGRVAHGRYKLSLERSNDRDNRPVVVEQYIYLTD